MRREAKIKSVRTVSDPIAGHQLRVNPDNLRPAVSQSPSFTQPFPFHPHDLLFSCPLSEAPLHCLPSSVFLPILAPSFWCFLPYLLQLTGWAATTLNNQQLIKLQRDMKTFSAKYLLCITRVSCVIIGQDELSWEEQTTLTLPSNAIPAHTKTVSLWLVLLAGCPMSNAHM